MFGSLGMLYDLLARIQSCWKNHKFLRRRFGAKQDGSTNNIIQGEVEEAPLQSSKLNSSKDLFGGCIRVLTFQISSLWVDLEQNRNDFFQFTQNQFREE